MTPTDPTELEARRHTAMLAGDLDTLDELLADDLVYTHSTASVDSKASYLDTLRTGTIEYLALEHTVEEVRTRPGVVVATGVMSGEVRVHDAVRRLNSRYTAVWVAAGERWQMLAFEPTVIPG